MSEALWLVLPLPNRALSPNARVAKYVKWSAAKKQKRLTIEAIEQQAPESIPWSACKVSVTLYCKTKRKRDADNAVSMLKSMYDGIVAAGVVTDDTPEIMMREWPVFDFDKDQPRMEVYCEKVGD